MAPDDYAEHVARVKRAVQIPVIASMNGSSAESWLRFAKTLEQAGADALELNLYEVVTDLSTPSIAIERHTDRHRVRREAFADNSRGSEGVAVLLGVRQHGASTRRSRRRRLGPLHRFNQPDIDIKTATVVPRAELSTSAELLLRLRWIAILHGRCGPPWH